MRASIRLVAAAGTLALAGCGGDSPAPKPSAMTKVMQSPPIAKNPVAPTAKRDDDHSHERGKMLLADAGKHHALLTAHLSPQGNELDLFFETADEKTPAPVALPLASIKGFANRNGDEKTQEIEFTPAPAEERPKDEKPGTCSHFVAKASWMKSTDNLTVTVRLEFDGERRRMTWENFNPKKYAHHEEK